MRKSLIALSFVAGLFVLGLALVLSAAFTTHTTEFAGTVELNLKFMTADRKDVTLELTDAQGASLKPDSNGYYLLRPKFETRDTNIFDTFGEKGPLPRTAIVSFKEAGGKSHEIQFVYDRNGRVWQANVQFPDPTISGVEVVNSSLDFKGSERNGDREKRRFDSLIYAKAIVGPSVIKND
jgi:hypothetical protein